MPRFRVLDLGAAGVVRGGRIRTGGGERRIQLRWACAGMDTACSGLRVDPGFPIRLRLGSAWSLPGEDYGVIRVPISY